MNTYAREAHFSQMKKRLKREGSWKLSVSSAAKRFVAIKAYGSTNFVSMMLEKRFYKQLDWVKLK